MASLLLVYEVIYNTGNGEGLFSIGNQEDKNI
jgi:hypothetical protein